MAGRQLVFLIVLFLSIGAFGQSYVPGEVIVKLRSDEGSQKTYAFFGKAHSDKHMTLKNSFARMRMYHFGLKPGQSVEATVAELRKDPNVEYAEPNYLMNKASVSEITTKYSYDEIQSLAEGDEFLATNAPIQASKVWGSLSVSSTKPIVAVIDTGLDITHPVFVGSQAVWVNQGEIPGNGMDDDGNGYVDDVNGWNFVSGSGNMFDDDGHGTHVSGIILGVGQDIFTAPFAEARIQLMPLKFLDDSGVGKTSDAIQAIYYAVNNGAKILNNSWGGPSYSTALHEAVVYAFNAGSSFVAAAGNTGGNNDVQPMYPASYSAPNLAAIAATTDLDSLASFSNYGVSSVHLGSPGVFIMSTVPGGGYGSSSGTSMAAPFVSGVAALMLVESPEMMGPQLREIILGQADSVSSLNAKLVTGSRVNVYNAVEAAKTAIVETELPVFSASTEDRQLASTLASAGGCGLVNKIYSDFNGRGGGPKGGPSTWYILLVVGLFLVPFVVVNVMRSRDPQNRRRHERYKIDSEVKVQVGDKTLVGSISTISLGGVQLNTEALLEDGGLVSMKISSPDGAEQVEVEGRVVWSESKKAYGVQFADTKSSVLNRISDWTKSLAKAS